REGSEVMVPILVAPASSLTPASAAGAVLQCDSEVAETLADLVGHGEVLRLAGFLPQVDQQLHQASHEFVIGGRRRRRRLAEEAEDAAQLAKHRDAAIELLQVRGCWVGAFEPPGIGEAVESREQLVETADGAAGVEVVSHRLQEGGPQASDLVEE